MSEVGRNGDNASVSLRPIDEDPVVVTASELLEASRTASERVTAALAEARTTAAREEDAEIDRRMRGEPAGATARAAALALRACESEASVTDQVLERATRRLAAVRVDAAARLEAQFRQLQDEDIRDLDRALAAVAAVNTRLVERQRQAQAVGLSPMLAHWMEFTRTNSHGRCRYDYWVLMVQARLGDLGIGHAQMWEEPPSCLATMSQAATSRTCRQLDPSQCRFAPGKDEVLPTIAPDTTLGARLSVEDVARRQRLRTASR